MSEAIAVTPSAIIRHAKADEVVLIEASWKKSFWRESVWARRISWQVFSRGHQPIIWRLLERSTVLVACDPKRPEEQLGLGYVVFENGPTHDGCGVGCTPAIHRSHTGSPAIHFLWVHAHERGKGIGRFLFEQSGLPRDLAGVAVTHATSAWFGPRALSDRFKLAVHDPYRWMET